MHRKSFGDRALPGHAGSLQHASRTPYLDFVEEKSGVGEGKRMSKSQSLWRVYETGSGSKDVEGEGVESGGQLPQRRFGEIFFRTF